MTESEVPLCLEDAVKAAKEDPEPIICEDKDPDQIPAAYLKSRMQARHTHRTKIKLEKKRRRTIKEAPKQDKKPPKFIFDDGGMSFAASSIGNESAISSGSLIRVPVFNDAKSVGSTRSNSDNKSFGSARFSKGSRKYYGLSKDLQDAASVTSRGSTGKYQKSFQDPPAAVLPQGLQFGAPVIMNQSQALEKSVQLPQVGDNEGLLGDQQRKMNLDDYVNKISNTRFISDDENATGSLLYRTPSDLPGDVEAGHRSLKNDSDGSANKFLRWYIQTESSSKRTKFGIGALLMVLIAVAVTLVVVLTGNSNDGGSEDTQSSESLASGRPVPPRPLPASPPVFNPDNVPLVAPSGEIWNSDTLKAMLEAFSHSSTLEDDSAPQGKAFKWLVGSNLDKMNSMRVQQRYVLAVLYFSFQVESWTNESHWMTLSHECTWFGVKCGSDGSNSFPVEGGSRRLADGIALESAGTFGTGDRFAEHVTYISLEDNNLHGNLPKELKSLTSLVQLMLSKNFVEGSIPDGLFSGFHQLHTLYLDKNFITGQLPDQFNHMDFLVNLDISGNSFEGSIPSTLQFLNDIVDIRLSNNAFSGTVPDVFAKTPNLSVFIAGNNEIEGSIPASLANAANLITLYLHENELQGTIPDFSSTKLKQIHLDSNDLSGGIPSLQAFTTDSLEEIRFEGNKLTGSLPVEIGDHTNLKLLWVNGNRLKGAVPHELGRLEQMTSFQLDGNLLEGTIPDSICVLKSNHALSSLRATCSGTNPDLVCSCCDSC